jgi:adhesin/invasin
MTTKYLELGRRLIDKTVPAIVSIACLLALASCGNNTNPLPASTSGTSGGTSAPSGPTSSGLAYGCAYYSVVSSDVICLTITTSSATIAADGTSTATITANLTRNGSAFPGQVITFSLGATGYGTLTQTTALTSTLGIATTTFTAGTTLGAVQINVTFDNAKSYVGVGLTSTGGATPTTALSPGCAYSTVAPTTDVICVTVATPTTSLTADGTSTATITATVTKNGSPLSGVVTNFTLSSSSYGTLLSSSGLTAATTGQATTTFKAGTTLGAVTITGTYNAASSSVSIGLVASSSTTAAGGIQFISASPSTVGVQGSGLQTTSSVVFKVTDATGLAIAGSPVSFSMVGPTGAYIGPTPGSTTATGTTDSSGNVAVTLNSGNVAGPATITASVSAGGSTFSASSSVLSIGGGIASATHFTLAASQLNLPGFSIAGYKTNLTVYVADRFSNSAVLKGTQVSFFTEAGAVDPNVSLDETGMGQVALRTQDPMPVNTVVLNTPQSLGHVTVIAVVRGEEAFVDTNANGVYDAGESFTDIGEPFIDANDNNTWDPGEYYMDTNGNGAYDGPNGVWDGPGCTGANCVKSPNIWVKLKIQFTGDIVICSLSPAGSFTVGDGGYIDYTVTVSDGNLNYPVPGTVITVTQAGGTLLGQTSFTVPDAVSFAPFQRTVRLADTATGDVQFQGSITLTVTPPSGGPVACIGPTLYGLFQ